MTNGCGKSVVVDSKRYGGGKSHGDVGLAELGMLTVVD